MWRSTGRFSQIHGLKILAADKSNQTMMQTRTTLFSLCNVSYFNFDVCKYLSILCLKNVVHCTASDVWITNTKTQCFAPILGPANLWVVRGKNITIKPHRKNCHRTTHPMKFDSLIMMEIFCLWPVRITLFGLWLIRPIGYISCRPRGISAREDY